MVLSKIFLVLAMCLACGLGSSLVQVFAWATMIPDQLEKTGDVMVAIENTFDGEHACSMCAMAAEMREAEQESEQRSPEKPVKQERVKPVEPYYVTSFDTTAAAVFEELEILRTGSYIECLCRRESKVETPPPRVG